MADTYHALRVDLMKHIGIANVHGTSVVEDWHNDLFEDTNEYSDLFKWDSSDDLEKKFDVM